MPHKPYSPEEKQKAIDAYLAHGVQQASQLTGIKPKTISSWVSQAGVAKDLSKNRQIAVTRSQEEFELRRENLKHRILDEAESLLDSMSSSVTVITKEGKEVTVPASPRDKQALMTGFGIAFDKLQLATGRPTENTITSDVSLRGLIETQRAKNEAIKGAMQEQAAAEA